MWVSKLTIWARGFNPRACGRRDNAEIVFDSGDLVSIHAPAGGAITIGQAVNEYHHGFNPRACGRRDYIVAYLENKLDVFQSTRLREARFALLNDADGRQWFQSTRLREARFASVNAAVPTKKFQSTRLREARLSISIKIISSWMFQSTRLREARLSWSYTFVVSTSVSIHAPAGGAIGANHK